MSSEELNNKRESIDQVDSEIVALLNKRLNLASAIGADQREVWCRYL